MSALHVSDMDGTPLCGGASGRGCAAHGDSMSDAPLFRHLRHTVAVNAGAHLARPAAVEYRGDDLRAADALARGLLRSAP